MKEIKINLPIDCEIGNVSAKIENGCIVVMCEPKKEFKFGDFVRTVYFGRENHYGILTGINNNGRCIIKETDGYCFEGDVLITDLLEARDFEKIDIQHYLDKNNLVIDYEKKKIVKKRWRGKRGEIYWIVLGDSTLYSANDVRCYSDNLRFDIGNYFRTKEQAEKVAKEIREVFEKHKND